MAFAGFPRPVRFIPVPAPLFGPLLEQIDDLAELKCTLRIIWHLHHKRGYPRFVTLDELLADRVLARALAAGASPGDSEVRRALARAVERGALLAGAIGRDGHQVRVYTLNSESDRAALEKMGAAGVPASAAPQPGAGEVTLGRPNIYALYEDNIGMLSPMIADELREAEQVYPASWIEEAFREAVAQNRRSWRYIARILQRWEREGKGDGEPGRYPKKAGYRQEHLRR